LGTEGVLSVDDPNAPSCGQGFVRERNLTRRANHWHIFIVARIEARAGNRPRVFSFDFPESDGSRGRTIIPPERKSPGVTARCRPSFIMPARANVPVTPLLQKISWNYQ
jgi:hypothetical protein